MEKKSDTFQIAADIQWEYAGDGIVRQIMGYDEHLMMVKVKFDQGAIGTLHQHPHTQSTYVASGSFEVTIGEEKKILKAGDGYYVAPNLLHGCVCLEVLICLVDPRLQHPDDTPSIPSWAQLRARGRSQCWVGSSSSMSIPFFRNGVLVLS